MSKDVHHVDVYANHVNDTAIILWRKCWGKFQEILEVMNRSEVWFPFQGNGLLETLIGKGKVLLLKIALGTPTPLIFKARAMLGTKQEQSSSLA